MNDIYMQMICSVMYNSLQPHGLPVHGIPFPSPRDLTNPGIEPRSPVLQADSLPSQPSGKNILYCSQKCGYISNL